MESSVRRLVLADQETNVLQRVTTLVILLFVNWSAKAKMVRSSRSMLTRELSMQSTVLVVVALLRAEHLNLPLAARMGV